MFKLPLHTWYEKNSTLCTVDNWTIPAYFSSPLDEINATKHKCALYDVSHYCHFSIQGKKSTELLQHLCLGDVNLNENQIQYNVLCNNQGFIIDTVFILCYSKQNYLLISSPSTGKRMYSWLQNNAKSFSVTINDLCSDIAMFELTGPLAHNVALKEQINYSMPWFSFDISDLDQIPIITAHCGFTGQDSYLILICDNNPFHRDEKYQGDPKKVKYILSHLLKSGKKENITLAGAYAHKSAQIEAGILSANIDFWEKKDDMPLKGVSPLNCHLNNIVTIADNEFVGKKSILSMKKDNNYILHAFEAKEKTSIRFGAPIYVESKKDSIGFVTNVSTHYENNCTKGFCYIKINKAYVGDDITLIENHKKFGATLVAAPFESHK